MLFKFLPFKPFQQYLEQTIMATMFYMCGYYMKRQFGAMNKSRLCIALFIPLLITAFWWHTGMAGVQGAKGGAILPYTLLAISGTIALLTLSAYIKDRKIGKLFIYLGSKTLYILTFHFLAFKAISFIYLSITGFPVELLTQFPVLLSVAEWMWLIYTLGGVVIPLSFWKFSDKLATIFPMC